jgi:hypothetical protein
VVVRGLPTGNVASSNRQPTESDVVHDHIGLRQHQIFTVAGIVVRIGTRHVKHAGTIGRCKTMGCSPCRAELSPGWGSTEMIGNGCSDAYCKVLVKRVSENLLPTAQRGGFGGRAF